MQQIISGKLNDDATLSGSKGKQGVKSAKIFAIRRDFSPMLDVARKTHQENLNDIHHFQAEFSAEHGLDGLALEWHETGFLFILKGENRSRHLPREAIDTDQRKAKTRFTTRDLKKLNARILQSQREVFILSDRIVSDMINELIDEISALYELSESIAILDVMLSFARVSGATIHACIRPEFVETCAVTGGRHPILNHKLPQGACVPNNMSDTRPSDETH